MNRRGWQKDMAATSSRCWRPVPARMDRAVAAFTRELFEVAAPQPGGRVLDIGCGPGTTVLELAKRVGPGGHVLGADVSEPSVARARERIAAAGLRHAEVIVADASVHPFPPDRFELTFSRFGIMFFSESSGRLCECAARDEAGRAVDAGSIPPSKREAVAERSTRSSTTLAAPDPDTRTGGARPFLLGRSGARASDIGRRRAQGGFTDASRPGNSAGRPRRRSRGGRLRHGDGPTGAGASEPFSSAARECACDP
jgi:SAM-dependent methyltransferase